MRPRLCLVGYRILADRLDPPKAVLNAAACLELFHAFMLVHDDLIDGSILRRDAPTLHEAIRRDADDPADQKTSADLGLLAGDILFALGMRLLGRAGLTDAIMGRVHRLVSEMLLETGLGEALDVLYGDCPLGDLSEDQILEAYLRKTARYSVSGPVVVLGRPWPARRRRAAGPCGGSATCSAWATRSAMIWRPSTPIPSMAIIPTSTAASGRSCSGRPTIDWTPKAAAP